MPGKISRGISEKTPLKHLNTNSPYNLKCTYRPSWPLMSLKVKT